MLAILPNFISPIFNKLVFCYLPQINQIGSNYYVRYNNKIGIDRRSGSFPGKIYPVVGLEDLREESVG
jgi:hypothetical protein